jgi:hypothetical protein
MNISPLTIYLWQLCDRLPPICILFGVVLGFATIILFITSQVYRNNAGAARVDAASADYAPRKAQKEKDAVECDKMADRLTCCWHRTLPVAMLSFIGWSLAPSSNTVAMMVVIPQIADSKVVQQDLPDLYNAAVEALKANLKKP